MTNKKAKIIKVKVKPVASPKTNIESQEISKVTLSAELLKEIIYMVFLFLALICVFANTGGIYFILSNYSNLIYRVLIISNSLLIAAQIIMTIIYSFILKNKKLKKTLLIFIALSLFILAFCLALSLLKIFSQNTMQILTCFIIINIASILSCLFVAIANEILSENDKNYIVGYFSALTSFSALIVSLVAFLKK